jgi:excisionase family DNA binding protein
MQISTQPKGQNRAPGSNRSRQPIEAASLPDALLTTPTACAVLGLSEATLYRLAAAGKLTPVKLSTRCTRWRSADVRAFMAAQS